jgi:glycine betaine/choline ABC-type transport system substrate-binding protein
LAEETFGWLFVGNTPLLYDKKKVARQYQVETWLDLAQVVKELGISNLFPERRTANQTSYIV